MRTYYQRLGEELALRPLIERFYHLMENKRNSSEFANFIHDNWTARAPGGSGFCAAWLGGPTLSVSLPGEVRASAVARQASPSPSRAANAISGWRGCAKTGKKSDSKGRCLGRLQLSALPDCRSMVAGPMMAPEQESLTL